MWMGGRYRGNGEQKEETMMGKLRANVIHIRVEEKKKCGDKQRKGMMKNGSGKRKLVRLGRVKERKINIKYNI